MKTFNLKPLLDRFNDYITMIGSETDVAGAKKEFSELIKTIFVPFNYSKATREQIAERIKQHDAFIVICDTIRASEFEETYVIVSLALTGRANAYQASGDLDNAAKDFRRSADAAAGFDGGEEIRIAAVINLANIYGRQQKTEDSITCYGEALKIAARIKTGDSDIRKMSILADRGSAYCRVRKLQEAYGDFSAAMLIYDNLPDKENDKIKKVLLKCLSNRSGILVNMQRFEEAKQDGLRVLEIEGETYSSVTPVALTNLAAACKCLGLVDEAEKYYSRVIMIKKVTGGIKTPAGRMDLATLMLGRGEVLLGMERYAEAREVLSESAALFEDLMEKHEAAAKPRLERTLKFLASAEEGIKENG